MTFQPGNPGGGKRREKQFYDALNMEIAGAEDGKDLRQIARNVMKKALSPEDKDFPWAVSFIADRLDGKPLQQQLIEVNETKTVVRAPAVKPSTEAWQQRQLTASNTTSSGNPSQARKLNS